MVQVVIKTATGVVAWILLISAHTATVYWTYLEHLNKSNTQVQICFVTANQAQTEEDADGNDCAKVHAARHGHLFP